MTANQNKILSEKYSWVKLDDPAFSKAFDMIINTNENLMILGSGGTGKSVLLKIASSILEGNTVVLSTTGISAANLASEGVATATVHSFFRLPPVTVVENPTMYSDLTPVIENVDTILIDEISMLNASVMDTILKLIKRYRAFQIRRLPRIILFGDVLQLPPVVDEKDATIQALFKRKYQGMYMFYHAEEYIEAGFRTIHLNRIYRQNDNAWKAILNRIRVGSFTNEDIDIINSRVVDERKFIDQHDMMMYLASTNNRVKSLNEFYLDSDNGQTFHAVITGKYDNRNTMLEQEVTIAPGMQVMCTHNNKHLLYQNGTLGRVISVSPTSVTIKTNQGDVTTVVRETWEQYQYNYDSQKDIVEHSPIGSFEQIGCKPAFATTIHKSQGLTLDCMMLDTSGLLYMSPGLAYVALSRCTTLEGIGLARPIRRADIRTNIDGLKFLEENK